MYGASGGNPSLTKCLVQGSQKKAQRKVPGTADKILDAPDILDNYCEYRFMYNIDFHILN